MDRRVYFPTLILTREMPMTTLGPLVPNLPVKSMALEPTCAGQVHRVAFLKQRWTSRPDMRAPRRRRP